MRGAGQFNVLAETLQAIRKAVIQAKLDLSDEDSTEIVVEPQGDLPNGYRRTITRAEFETLIEPLVDRTLGPVRMSQVEEARAEIVRTIRALEAAGDITVQRADEDEYVY